MTAPQAATSCDHPERIVLTSRRIAGRLGKPCCLLISSELFAAVEASIFVPFGLPHHVLRSRDRCRTITSLLLVGILPEPVHAALSEAEISAIAHFARVPGKVLPQEAPSGPVLVSPPPALTDLHDAHPHPGFTMRQHSAHVEIPPARRDVTPSQTRKDCFRSEVNLWRLTVARVVCLISLGEPACLPGVRFWDLPPTGCRMDFLYVCTP